MGVVNVTPDSFFDGGRLRSPDEAAAYARSLASQGADLLDVGGESTRPGARPLSPSQELRRVLPVVERLARTSETLLSVDTRHAEVARQALRAGAHVVNDVGGFRDPALRRVVRREEAGAVVMHMRGTPRTMQRDVRYRDLRAEVYAFLEDRTRLAEDEGIPPEALVVDPGLGFGKSFSGTWELLGHVRELRALGYPVLVGASRKGFLGALLGGAPPAERLEVSVAAALLAVERGAAVVRVHDVGPTARALRVLRALRPGPAGAGPSGVCGSGAGSSGASKGPARAGSPARGPPSPRRPRPGRPGPGPGSRPPREAP
jgi:dihydropteroate synthase